MYIVYVYKLYMYVQGWQIDLETWKKFPKRFWLFFQVIPGHFFQKII